MRRFSKQHSYLIRGVPDGHIPASVSEGAFHPEEAVPRVAVVWCCVAIVLGSLSIFFTLSGVGLAAPLTTSLGAGRARRPLLTTAAGAHNSQKLSQLLVVALMHQIVQ